MNNQYLFSVLPINISVPIACRVGLTESIILQQISFYLINSTKEKDGKKWICISYKRWHEEFPFWSISTIKRAVKNLVDCGLIIIAKRSQDKKNRVNYYTIDYDVLNNLFSTNIERVQNDTHAEGQNGGQNDPQLRGQNDPHSQEILRERESEILREKESSKEKENIENSTIRYKEKENNTNSLRIKSLYNNTIKPFNTASIPMEAHPRKTLKFSKEAKSITTAFYKYLTEYGFVPPDDKWYIRQLQYAEKLVKRYSLKEVNSLIKYGFDSPYWGNRVKSLYNSMNWMQEWYQKTHDDNGNFTECQDMEVGNNHGKSV